MAECKMKFSKTSNLRDHVKRKRTEKLDILVNKNKNHICRDCSATFVNLANLRVHVKRKHPGKLEELAPVKQKVFECKQCKSKFKMLKDLTLHKKSCAVVKAINCPLCQFSSSSSTMIKHFKQIHSLEINIETLEFDSFEDFMTWKYEIERESFASFVNMHGFRQGLNCRKVKYTCHRSGDFRNRGKFIRRFKTQGTNKIGAYCPAEINVEISDQKCMVIFCKTHVGHGQEQDLEHIFLSSTDRQHIAAKIALNIPFQTILDDIKDSMSNSQLERLHLLTKKDLYNIERSFNLNARHSNDTCANELNSTSSEDFLFTEDNSIIDQNDSTEESNYLINDTSEEQQNLIKNFQQQVLETNSLEELEAIKKIIALIKPSLDAIRSNNKQNNKSLLPSTSQVTANKKLEPQKLVKTIKKSKKTETKFLISNE